jgi:hypothetical protein
MITVAEPGKLRSFEARETKETFKRLLEQIDNAGDDREPLIRLFLLVLLKQLAPDARTDALKFLRELGFRSTLQ